MPERGDFGYALRSHYTQDMDDIIERWGQLRKAIQEAAVRNGRARDAVRLIAVSKNHPPALLSALAESGQRDFGESRTQEATQKMTELDQPELEWHFLGPLQRNKARFIPGRFRWLHSLESLALAEALSRHAASLKDPLQVLIEVNMTGDPRKHGLQVPEVPRFLEAYCAHPWPGLALRGFMTIGPHHASPAATGQVFAELRQLAERSQRDFDLPECHELSMGMSDDYLQAISEGATMVRVGRALFGERT